VVTDHSRDRFLLKVGDGLEIYVIVAPGSTPQGLDAVKGIQEVTVGSTDGERVFVIRRELKKD